VKTNHRGPVIRRLPVEETYIGALTTVVIG
jgi:hypothetical protein